MDLNKPIKIAVFATTDISIRFLLLEQILRLKAESYEVSAICGNGPWIKEIENAGIKVKIIKIVREINPWQDLKTLIYLGKYFKQEKFDIVNTHTPKAGILGPIAARLAGTPIIIHTVHGFLFFKEQKFLHQLIFRTIERITAICSHYLFSQSQEDVEVAIKYKICKPEKIFYIGNGIDINKFNRQTLTITPEQKRTELGIQPDEVVIGIIGRLVYEKGFREFFLAVRELIKRFNNLKFLIIGPKETDQTDALKLNSEIIKKLENTGKLIFLGMRRDTTELYSIMDIFVLPTYREGMPRATMEASAMEVPVVATNIRGCREIIIDPSPLTKSEGVDKKTGLLVPMKNYPALVEAISYLIVHPEERIAMGKTGREHIVKNFDQEMVFERIVKLYKKLTQINTDVNTDKHRFLYEDLSYKLRGVFFGIRNTYGPGQKESVYHKLLEKIFKRDKISFEKEKAINIYTIDGKIAGTYKPDFVIDDKIIIEVKSSRFTTKTDEKQLYYYLRNSKYEIGFLVNFSTPQLYIKRIIYTNDRKPFLKSV